MSAAGSKKTLRSSVRSRGSSVSSAKAKAAAKRAMLQAEAANMERLHQLESEELKLQQRKKSLMLETEMAKAKAEEMAYGEAEVQETPPVQTEMSAMEYRQLMLLREDVQKANQFQGTDNPTEKPFRLDPDAPSWGDRATHQPNKKPEGKEESIQQLLLQQQQAIMALTLPQPDVPVFKGDPIEYCDFMRAFENLIEKRTQSASQRLFYLLQYTSGQAQDLVRSCLVMKEKEGYDHARQLLADRYGHGYKIATAHIDRLTNGPTIRADDGTSLQRFSILLTSCMNTLKEIGYLNRLENPDALKRVVHRLPFGLKVRWRDLVDNIFVREKRDPVLQDLAAFVESNSRAANHPIFGKITHESKGENLSKSKP